MPTYKVIDRTIVTGVTGVVDNVTITSTQTIADDSGRNMVGLAADQILTIWTADAALADPDTFTLLEIAVGDQDLWIEYRTTEANVHYFTLKLKAATVFRLYLDDVIQHTDHLSSHISGSITPKLIDQIKVRNASASATTFHYRLTA